MSEKNKKQSRREFLKKGAAFGAVSVLAGTGLSSSVLQAETSTEKLALLKDHSICIECYACRVACQNENGFPDIARTIEFESLEMGNYPDVEYHRARMSCFHCNDAPCIDVCPVDAIEKGYGELNITDIETCIGCEECVAACPFDVPQVVDEEMYKCNGCTHLVEKDEDPACVSTCPTYTLDFGTQREMAEQAEERIQELEAEGKEGYLYGLEAQDGLGLLMITTIEPDHFSLV
ncbi:4Fe-4S dicluster domain-containing protein [Halarsenatibacter silvermanii]|uniref:Respiratory nitrite reductase specific menaquinol--cytochrome-c reductase complex Fe-S cluster containing subunit NrfC n=1 Tax=Halarsenatibacter silvermanii TaxID=321763 RepID=A0A1G9S6Q0_9FIRM|nr:4Fe-4S dicluster domain-containing protein [Halarsenatibacter silvermanii]SDM30997.1 respiratory nitrite reductase specific menaquinol--cytochrome-c reductase complex Fe-S cluster containing subunit NrfC [Halarsenatibacter silvermanii]